MLPQAERRGGGGDVGFPASGGNDGQGDGPARRRRKEARARGGSTSCRTKALDAEVDGRMDGWTGDFWARCAVGREYICSVPR